MKLTLLIYLICQWHTSLAVVSCKNEYLRPYNCSPQAIIIGEIMMERYLTMPSQEVQTKGKSLTWVKFSRRKHITSKHISLSERRLIKQGRSYQQICKNLVWSRQRIYTC